MRISYGLLIIFTFPFLKGAEASPTYNSPADDGSISLQESISLIEEFLKNQAESSQKVARTFNSREDDYDIKPIIEKPSRTWKAKPVNENDPKKNTFRYKYNGEFSYLNPQYPKLWAKNNHRAKKGK